MAAPVSEVTMPTARGKAGIGLLAGGIEEALGLKLALERLEPGLEFADAGALDPLDDDLELAAGFVDAGLGEDADFHAVLHHLRARPFACTEHAALDLRAIVLEREIPVAAGLFLQVRDLAFDPELAELDLQQVLHPPHQLGDGEGLRGGGGFWREEVHGDETQDLKTEDARLEGSVAER